MVTYNSSLYHVSNVVVPDLNVVGLFMKYEIIFQSDPTPFMAIYDYNMWNILKWMFKELSQLDYLTASHDRNNVFYLNHD